MVDQCTLSDEVTLSGVALHSGLDMSMTLKPACVDYGIRFRRTDIIGPTEDIRAIAENVTSLARATTISNSAGHSVSTIEHLMAACTGVGLDNMLVEIDGPEVPIMDGSSLDFCNIFNEGRVRRQSMSRRIIRILEPVSFENGSASASLRPSDSDVLSLSARIEFEDRAIGTQQASLALENGAFCEHLSYARTFGRSSELAGLQARGLALGGSLDNAILVDDDKIVNPGGLRSADEFIRHKLLDAIGDLALAGANIAGHYEAVRPGHALNLGLVRALLDTPTAWCWETQDADMDVFHSDQPAVDLAEEMRA